jgi:hypothetical protein
LVGLAMEDVGKFQGQLVYIMAMRYVYLLVIWYIFPVLVCYSKKNLATLGYFAILSRHPFTVKTCNSCFSVPWTKHLLSCNIFTVWKDINLKNSFVIKVSTQDISPFPLGILLHLKSAHNVFRTLNKAFIFMKSHNCK